MNLVAKEYCMCHPGEGALILSEFAGTAAQLGRWALTVNPYDVVGCTTAIHRAFAMPLDERRMRMPAMRRAVTAHNVYWWVDAALRIGEPSQPQPMAGEADDGSIRLAPTSHTTRVHEKRPAA